MSVQRRRANRIPVTFMRTKKTTDLRGNPVLMVDETNTYSTFAAWMPERSARAEVPGQQQIDVARLIVEEIPDVDVWSRVQVRGGEWDIVSPPEYHHGTRHLRHWSVFIRRRPD